MLEIIDKNNKQAYVHIDNLENLTMQGIRQGWFRLGKSLRDNLRTEMLKKNKRGRVYTRRIRGGARRRHKSSAAGQTPASRTGNYRKNVGFQLSSWSRMEFGVRSGAPYAKFLEDGTGKMAPRPGLGNSVKATQRNAAAFFESSLDKGLSNP